MTDVDHAVANARAAYNDGRWSGLSVDTRKEVLQTLAKLLESHTEEFALNECLDVGKPISMALKEDVPDSVAIIQQSAEGADKLLSPFGSTAMPLTYHIRKPVGVVGGIVGWNYPLVLAVTKMAPALAMGNSLVLKPSEFTSLSACRLAELAVEAGVPPGVFNVVHGAGETVGVALSLHKDVDLLSFTGSSETGKQLMIAAGQSNMKRLILECGGKSPYLVFDDAPNDLDFIASDIVSRAFANQGALCIASTRLLIQENIKKPLLEKILKRVASIVAQDPLDPDTSFGALMNEAHLKKVLSYIESGVEEGAQLIYGGQATEDISGGYYLGPTIFDGVDPLQKIAQEEIFG
ncbi:MAG: aldehyde dehydrogenase family protein, partial [Spongiibacteraceae bacterium]|nr:aldehyde dehydrogenase family protein [Spongiibacteraceae bacterium]